MLEYLSKTRGSPSSDSLRHLIRLLDSQHEKEVIRLAMGSITVKSLIPLLFVAILVTSLSCGGGGGGEATPTQPAESQAAIGPTPTPIGRFVGTGVKTDQFRGDVEVSDKPLYEVAPTPTPEAEESQEDDPEARKKYDGPPPMTIDPTKTYTATLVMENGGQIVIQLFAEEMPITVNNFVFLAREGFYDGLTFCRVIPGDRALTGDPNECRGVTAGYKTGFGGPEYQFDDEISEIRHDEPGRVSMFNRGEQRGRGTNGSQFFIGYVADHSLDVIDLDGYKRRCGTVRIECAPAFGQVIRGMDVVEELSPRDPDTDTSQGDVVKQVIIAEE